MSDIGVQVNRIPPQLKNQLIWVLWRYVTRGTSTTKLPYQPSGQMAKCNDPQTWASFSEVHDAYTASQRNGRHFDGIGIALGCEVQGRTLVGIDIDSCRYADGTLTTEASQVLERVGSYAEVSPSGFGVKVLALIDEPIELNGKTGFKYEGADLEQTCDQKAAEVAYYQSDRYFCLTGQVLDGHEQLRPSHGVSDVVAEYQQRKDAARATKTSDTASKAVATTTVASATGDFTERQKTALAAIQKVPVDPSENDGSNRLLNYCRQAKRFMLTADDCLRVIKAAIQLYPFPRLWTDREIIQRIGDADVSFGQDFEQRVATATATLSSNHSAQITETLTINPIKFRDLYTAHPELRKPVIHGLLREQEVVNLIAAPKVGKSFLASNLAASIAKGCPWLGHAVEQGYVMLIDNELHPETLAHRLNSICCEMQLSAIDESFLEAVVLRGKQVNLNDLLLINVEPGKYKLIVIDALYKMLPDGTSENDNAQMTKVYAMLDALANRWQCAIAIVHHSSKGDQSSKSVTDIGAGAGSISRSVDCHIAIRPHETEGLCVLEAEVRNWKQPEPMSVKFEYPLWVAVAVQPELKTPRGGAERKQEANDRQADQAVRKALEGTEGLSRPQLRTKTGYGDGRINRAIVRLTEAGKVTLAMRKNRKTGRRIEVVKINPECTE